MTENEADFVHEVATAMSLLGMPISAGRFYAYLLLRSTPISLDEIATELSVSKSSAWNTAKHLERYEQIRRYGEPGGKRTFYAPSQDFGGMLQSVRAMLRRLSAAYANGAAHVAEGEAAVKLGDRAKFLRDVYEVMETTIVGMASAYRPARGTATAASQEDLATGKLTSNSKIKIKKSSRARRLLNSMK